MHDARVPFRWAVALLIGTLGFFVAAGCGPTLEQSNTAVSLPAAFIDSDEAQGRPDCWPGFRGYNTSGISHAERLPVEWSSESGYQWRVDVPGEGNSSPVVWQDRLFLTSAVEQGDHTELVVLCYDLADGALLWQTAAGKPSGTSHNKNGHASASVTTDGEHVFVFFGSAGLFCLDFGGELVWHTQLGQLEHIWGTAASPMLFGDLVIQLADRQSDSFLAAYHKQTGEQIWRADRASYGSWGTPVLVDASLDGGERRSEIIVNGTGTDAAEGGAVIAYDPATGAPLWQVHGTTDIVCPTAIVAAGMVYSTSGRNGPTIAIRPGGSGDVTESHVVWKLLKGGAYVPTGVGYRNRLYTVSDGGVAACYDAGNGEQIWRSRLKGTFTASLIAGGGNIYATSERGTVYVFAADDEFQLLAQNEMQQRCLATPAVANGDLLLRTESKLYRIAAPPDVAATVEADVEASSRDPAETPVALDAKELVSDTAPRGTAEPAAVDSFVTPASATSSVNSSTAK